MKVKTLLIAVAILTVLAGITVANLAGQQQRASRTLPAAVQLTEAEEQHILYMREEEKLARDVYLTMYELWGAEIFANISESEQRHMDAIKNLITRYGLVDPVVDDLQVLDIVANVEAVSAGSAIADLKALDRQVAEVLHGDKAVVPTAGLAHGPATVDGDVDAELGAGVENFGVSGIFFHHPRRADR